MSAILLRSTSPDLMLCRLIAPDRAGVIAAMAKRLAEIDPRIGAEHIERVALAREEIESTGVGDRVALPHARTDGVLSTRLCVATLSEPVDWQSYDEQPVEAVFLILGSRRAPAQQLRVLADVSAVVRQPGFVEELVESADPASMYAAIHSASTRQG
ncbi:MAG: PTS sugar transporter subunit IIA [Gemmatimonadetes bacterium]|nr:PTS sugar transporter subunit IIA [Gemmatimonadota bacterium]